MMTTTSAVRATHVPVMLQSVVDSLTPPLLQKGSILVDATVGLGGHAAALLEACPQASLIGIDRDGQAIESAGLRLAPFGDRVHLVRARFDELGLILDAAGITYVQAILMDLGLSSMQIDIAGRGFAYTKDGPLDMRMDDRLDVDAAQIVGTWSLDELTRILRDYGEEPHARRVAQAIVDARPITTTGQLADVVMDAMPAAIRYGSGGHPAKRTFQALRIAVNDELSALAGVLPIALDRLGDGGRLAVLSYHSLEDRLVKQSFQQACQVRAPRGLPVVPPHLQPQFYPVTKGAVRPLPDEISENPRAASARFRVIGRAAKGEQR